MFVAFELVAVSVVVAGGFFSEVESLLVDVLVVDDAAVGGATVAG